MESIKPDSPHLRIYVFFIFSTYIDEENAKKVAKALEKLDKVFESNVYFHGPHLTETDIRIFTTVLRYRLY